jgi:hypothetical protein
MYFTAQLVSSDIEILPSVPLASVEGYYSKIQRWRKYGSYSPCTAEFPGLIPDFLNKRVVLDDDRVFHVTAAGGGRPVRPCCVVVPR